MENVNSDILKLFAVCCEKLLPVAEAHGYVKDWEYIHPNDVYDMQGAILDIHKFLLSNRKYICPPKSDEVLPPGYLYMCTITQKDTETRDDVMTRHDIVMEYYKQQEINVLLASLEHSNIWHIHYLIQSPRYIKNMVRDLSRRIDGRRVQLEKKISSLTRYYGACKYITKDGYNDNTSVEILIQKIHKVDGKGWVLEL